MKPRPSGIVLGILGILLIIVSYATALPGLLPVGILLLALPLFSLLLVFFTARGFSARIEVLAASSDGRPLAEVGSPLAMTVLVANRTRMATNGARLTLQLDHSLGGEVSATIPRLPAGESVSLTHRVLPLQRGIRSVQGVNVSQDGPFKLARLDKNVVTQQEVAVSAKIFAMGLPRTGQATRTMEDSTRLAYGSSARDYHTREYVPGDDLRHVHWASTARLGDLMVRHEAEEQSLSAVVIVDSEPARYDSSGAYELMYSAAASAVSVLLRAGYDVVVLDPRAPSETYSGPQALRRFRSRTARAQEHRGGEPEAGDPPPVALPPAIRQVAHLVVCCAREDQAAALLSGIPQSIRHRAVVLPAVEATRATDLLSEVFDEPLRLPEAWSTLSTRRSFQREYS